jgi:hypothetical protein
LLISLGSFIPYVSNFSGQSLSPHYSPLVQFPTLLQGPCTKARVAAAKEKEKARAEAKRLTMGGVAVAGAGSKGKKKPGGGRSVSPTKNTK